MLRIVSFLVIALLIFNCGAKKEVKTKPITEEEINIPGLLTDTIAGMNLPEKLFLNISVEDFGKMKVEMFPQDAPRNVKNVVNLAIKGFYNGLTFHRIEPGFVVQGGDPKGDGTGGPGYTVPAEIKRKHEKGSMAMARLPDQVNPNKESSGSQFYFCLQPLPQLDGKYTVIGKIVEGMDVLEKLGQAKPPVKIRYIIASTQ
ncbi:MAG: peptidylprolyl isomerase [candidate division WOR-3 bacterium]